MGSAISKATSMNANASIKAEHLDDHITDDQATVHYSSRCLHATQEANVIVARHTNTFNTLASASGDDKNVNSLPIIPMYFKSEILAEHGFYDVVEDMEVKLEPVDSQELHMEEESFADI